MLVTYLKCWWRNHIWTLFQKLSSFNCDHNLELVATETDSDIGHQHRWQGSTDHQFRRNCSESIRDCQNIVVSGPTRNFEIFSVLVRSGTRFLGRAGPRFPKIFRSWVGYGENSSARRSEPVLFRGSLIDVVIKSLIKKLTWLWPYSPKNQIWFEFAIFALFKRPIGSLTVFWRGMKTIFKILKIFWEYFVNFFADLKTLTDKSGSAMINLHLRQVLFNPSRNINKNRNQKINR